MATLSQLQSIFDKAKSNLDELIPKWNTRVGWYLDTRKYMDNIYCIKGQQNLGGINIGYDWDNIAFNINDYSDISKIKRNANISNLTCPGNSQPYGATPEVAHITDALNNINGGLAYFRTLYNDLMNKYQKYTSAKDALEKSPEYQGVIAAAQAEGAAAGKTLTTRWLIFGIIAVVLIVGIGIIYFKFIKK